MVYDGKKVSGYLLKYSKILISCFIDKFSIQVVNETTKLRITLFSQYKSLDPCSHGKKKIKRGLLFQNEKSFRAHLAMFFKIVFKIENKK